MNQLSEARLAALGRGFAAASVKWIGARDSEPRSSWRPAPLEGGAFAGLCAVLEQSCPLPHMAKRATLFSGFCARRQLGKVVNMRGWGGRSRRDERPSPIPAAQWEQKSAIVMAQELWAAVSSPRQRNGLFFSLDATKAANQIATSLLSAARFISANMMLQLKAVLL